MTGELDPLSEAVKRLSFQEHFVDLNRKCLKIIRRPIDTDEMRPFHMNKMSKVKDLLNMGQVGYTMAPLISEETAAARETVRLNFDVEKEKMGG